MKKLFLIALLASLAAGEKPPTVGVASWYGDECKGRTMANGKPFDPDALTCASWHYPFGTRLKITNEDSGESVIATCTDRGPAIRLKRIIDLSSAAFKQIAPLKQGLVTVRVEVLR